MWDLIRAHLLSLFGTVTARLGLQEGGSSRNLTHLIISGNRQVAGGGVQCVCVCGGVRIAAVELGKKTG